MAELDYRTLVDALADAVVIADADQTIVHVNVATERLLGWPRDELIGQPLTTITPTRMRAAHEEGFRRYMVTGERRILGRGPVRVAALRKDGTEVEIELTLSELTLPDGARAIIGALRDLTDRVELERQQRVSAEITSLKQAERSMRFLADASATLAASLDYETTLAKVADLAVPHIADWCTIHLVRPGDAHQTTRIVAHVDPSKVAWAKELGDKYPPDPAAANGVWNVIRTGRPELYSHIPDELLTRAARSAEHLAIVRAVGMRSAMIVPIARGGDTFGAISFIAAESGRSYSDSDLALAQTLADRAADAIENARLYADAKASRAEAEEANRLKDEFLATVSHELRTPVSAILGWVAILQTERRRDPASLAKAIAVIERNARSQLRIIDDILDVSRIVRGQIRIETVPIDLEDAARDALDSIRPAAAAKRIELVFSGCAESCRLVADPERLRQILWNLLSNAVKFTAEGGRVELAIRRAEGKLVVAVHDNGRGIEPGFLPFAFDRFRQGDGTTTRTATGLGLGLAIVRHLAEMHGGTVAAESAGVGKGSTFRVTLPIAPFTTPIEAPVSPAKIAERPLQGMRLLVVEDEEDSRELIDLVLTERGAQVHAVASADEALQALTRFDPHVLVSDIAMHGHDGYWLIAQVRKEHPQLPAIALTAFATPQDVARSRAAGFDHHFGKPVDPERLVEALASTRA